MLKRLYIIAGCNGAGKTTASFNILPELLQCKEFVNADEIAKGISPFQPESVSIEAGRIMLSRIDDLLLSGSDFAFETTLASRLFVSTIEKAKRLGYFVTLVFFWLDSVDLAKSRVKSRVSQGGHFIPHTVIERRYKAGIKNLLNLYAERVDDLFVFNNSGILAELIAERRSQSPWKIIRADSFNQLKDVQNE